MVVLYQQTRAAKIIRWPIWPPGPVREDNDCPSRPRPSRALLVGRCSCATCRNNRSAGSGRARRPGRRRARHWPRFGRRLSRRARKFMIGNEARCRPLRQTSRRKAGGNTITNQDPDMAKRSGAKRGVAAERLLAEEPGRGREARTPSQIPLRGWRDILLRIWANIGQHRVLAIAAGITFYGLLALFPGIAAALALYGFFADPHSAQGLFNQLSGVLPGGGQDILRDQITRLTAQPAARLGFAFILGLLISLWTASSGVRALIDALNIVYREEERRSLVKLYAFSIIATIAVIIFFLLVSLALIALPIVLDYLWLGSVSKFLLNLLRWPLLFCIGAFALAVIYRYGPSRNRGAMALDQLGECWGHQSRGSQLRFCSPGTLRISEVTTRPTALWAPSSAS